MDSVEVSKILYQSLIKGFIEVFKVFWEIDEFKSAIIGIPVVFVTFRIVGSIFRRGRSSGIWFGRRGGKIIYYFINTVLVWLVMKIV